MYLNISKVKKLFKDAYKNNGLIVGHFDNNEGYYITEGHFILWFAEDSMPKEIKAAVIELAGRLPEADEAFTAYEKEDDQYAMVNEKCYLPNYPFTDDSVAVKDSKLREHALHDVKYYEFINSNPPYITGVNIAYEQMIDLSKMDKMEMSPAGPYTNDAGRSIRWYRKDCCVAIYCILPSEKDVKGQQFARTIAQALKDRSA